MAVEASWMLAGPCHENRCLWTSKWLITCSYEHISVSLSLSFLPLSVSIFLLPPFGGLSDLELWFNSVRSSGKKIPFKHSDVESSPYEHCAPLSRCFSFTCGVYFDYKFSHPDDIQGLRHRSGTSPCVISMRRR